MTHVVKRQRLKSQPIHTHRKVLLQPEHGVSGMQFHWLNEALVQPAQVQCFSEWAVRVRAPDDPVAQLLPHAHLYVSAVLVTAWPSCK